MSNQVSPPLRWLGLAILRRPAERLDLLVIIPALVNLLWVLDIAPGGVTAWVLTVLMWASGATWVSVKLVRWRRRRSVHR